MSDFTYKLKKGEDKTIPLIFNDDTGKRMNFASNIFSFVIDELSDDGAINRTIDCGMATVSEAQEGLLVLFFSKGLIESIEVGTHKLRIKSDIGSANGDMTTMTNDPVSVSDG